MLRRIAAILLIVLLALVYRAIKPPPPKTCGSPGGPRITAPRIQLRDGRHLAYKEYGVPRQVAKHKIVFIHGFGSCRHDAVIATNLPSGLVEELGVYIVAFDRPGYGESDPDPNRSLKSLAFDVEELADKLELGSKFYVIGFSMGGQAVWGCLKFIPHREILDASDQSGSHVFSRYKYVQYWWFTQKWFPSSSAVQGNPSVFSPQDLELVSKLVRNREHKSQVQQQGEQESICRDTIVGFGSWDFDPFDIDNPFPNNNTGKVHLWQGSDDRLISATLQRYIAERIPWIQYHELPGAGHLFPYVPDVSAAIIKTQLIMMDETE